jgi:hypothetical protein
MGSTQVVSAPRSQASLSCSSPKSATSLSVPPRAATNRVSTSWIAWFTSWWLAGRTRTDGRGTTRPQRIAGSPTPYRLPPMAPCDCPVPPATRTPERLFIKIRARSCSPSSTGYMEMPARSVIQTITTHFVRRLCGSARCLHATPAGRCLAGAHSALPVPGSQDDFMISSPLTGPTVTLDAYAFPRAGTER